MRIVRPICIVVAVVGSAAIAVLGVLIYVASVPLLALALVVVGVFWFVGWLYAADLLEDALTRRRRRWASAEVEGALVARRARR